MDFQEAINTQMPCLEMVVTRGNITPPGIFIKKLRSTVICISKPPTRIRFTAPTHRVDGKPLKLNELVGYNIEISGRSVRVNGHTVDDESVWAYDNDEGR